VKRYSSITRRSCASQAAGTVLGRPGQRRNLGCAVAVGRQQHDLKARARFGVARRFVAPFHLGAFLRG
jgi:hypothetical protein